jgi:hypothetical protein
MNYTEDLKMLNRWADLFNKSAGYGGVFNYGTPEEKAIVEASTCTEWCQAISTEFGLAHGEVEHNPNDPPDCYVTVDGQRLSVELVQLVESKHKVRAVKGESPHSGRLFMDMQWSKDRLTQRLNEEVAKKGAKYAAKGLRVDALVIHTAETWLSSQVASAWLSEAVICQHPNIASAFLLFRYEPGRETQNWPVFWLYGTLGGARSS